MSRKGNEKLLDRASVEGVNAPTGLGKTRYVSEGEK